MAGSEEIARLVAVMEAQLRGFTKGMEQAQREADRRFGAIEKRMRTAETVFAGGFKNIGGLAARYLGAAAIIAFTRNLLAQADALQDTSQQLGVTTQEFQGLLSAARDTGAGVEMMKRGLSSLSDRLGDAAKGEGDLAKTMRELNIPMGTTMQVLFDLADAVQKAATQEEKMRLSTSALGLAGMTLVPVLDQGADGLRRMFDEAAKKGQVWDPETIAKLGSAHDAFERLKVTLTGKIADPFADVVGGLDKFIQDFTSHESDLGRWLDYLDRLVGNVATLGAYTRNVPQTSVTIPLKPFPSAPAGSAPRTAVPLSPASATAADKALKEEADALQDFHDHRQAMIDKNALEEAEALQEFHEKRQELIDKSNLDEEEALKDFHDRADAAWESYRERQDAASAEVGDTLRDAFDITGAAGIRAFDNIGDAAEQALQQIAAMAFQLGVMEPILNALFGKKGDPLGGIVGSLFSGMTGIPSRDVGGPVTAGRAYRIGKPEIFVPNVDGTIIPNVRAGGGDGVVNHHHFDLRGAVVTQDLLDQMNAISQRSAAGATIRGASLASRHATQNLQQQRRMTG